MRGWSRFFYGAVIAAILALALGWFLLEKPWMGIRENGNIANPMGAYRSLSACTREVEKTGGWCGKGCKVYGDDSIADCRPLVTITKRNSK
jgi:hypothetical protein